MFLRRYQDKPNAYRNALTSFKVFFNWCIRNELCDKHPLAGERAPVTKSRDRVLLPEELQLIWEYDYPHFSTIVKLCILTGQRRSEIAAIQQDWLHDDLLTFPPTVTKNKRKHTIPVTTTTKELLATYPGSYNGWSNGKKRIDKHVQILHWTLHDLRRTYSTIHAEIGTPIHITERLINHATGSLSGVVGIYNKYSYLDEMRTAQEKYEKVLMDIVES